MNLGTVRDFWFAVEVYVAIICACAPTLKPLFGSVLEASRISHVRHLKRSRSESSVSNQPLHIVADNGPQPTVPGLAPELPVNASHIRTYEYSVHVSAGQRYQPEPSKETHISQTNEHESQTAAIEAASKA